MGGAMGAFLEPSKIEKRKELASSIAKAVKKTQHSTTALDSNTALAGPSRRALKPKSSPLKLTKEQAEELALFEYNAKMAALCAAHGVNYCPLDQRSYIGDRANLPYKVELRLPQAAAAGWDCEISMVYLFLSISIFNYLHSKLDSLFY